MVLEKLDLILNVSAEFKEINFNLNCDALEDSKSVLWIKKIDTIKYCLKVQPIIDCYHLSTPHSSSNSANQSHRDRCKACKETMPPERNFVLLKKVPF